MRSDIEFDLFSARHDTRCFYVMFTTSLPFHTCRAFQELESPFVVNGNHFYNTVSAEILFFFFAVPGV